jgi:uncharacterized damage-inducible protein DinB
VDPTLDRLFRHEVFATRKTFEHLRALPEATLAMTAPNTDWDIAVLLTHIVSASMSYAARVDGLPEPHLEPPDTHADLAAMEPLAVAAAERLRDLVAEGSDAEVVERDGDKTWRYPRSVVLAQSVYHAIEHRAQLFGVLAANRVGGITLDDMDHWTLGHGEGVLSES